MNKWTVIIGIWLVAIIGIILYSHSFKGQHVSNLPPAASIDPKFEGPEVGDLIENQESPQQLTSRFLQYVNAGDYENASGLINPNSLLTYTSTRKEMSPHDALVAYVRIFAPQEVQSMQVSVGEVLGGNASVPVRITLKSSKKVDMIFQLQEFVTEGHAQTDRYWKIMSYEIK